MRWILRWIFVRNVVKCVELFFSPHSPLHRTSYISLPQKSMRWIFVRNAMSFAVNFSKKCGEIFIFTAFSAITAFLTQIHRIHRISYKNLPEKLRSGLKTPTIWGSWTSWWQFWRPLFRHGFRKHSFYAAQILKHIRRSVTSSASTQSDSTVFPATVFSVTLSRSSHSWATVEDIRSKVPPVVLVPILVIVASSQLVRGCG